MKDRGGFPAVVCPRCSRLQGRKGRAQANGLSGPTTNAELARQRVDQDLVYIEELSCWSALGVPSCLIAGCKKSRCFSLYQAHRGETAGGECAGVDADASRGKFGLACWCVPVYDQQTIRGGSIKKLPTDPDQIVGVLLSDGNIPFDPRVREDCLPEL